MRNSRIERKTKETNINGTLDIDGVGDVSINTGIGFFDHMLEAFTVHSNFDLELNCDGDLKVDGHHTIEDCGIVMGKAFSEAIGDKSGIERYGYFMLPMDESLANCALDIGGRAYLVFDADFRSEKIGDMETQMIREFFQAFVNNSMMTLHLNLQYGENDHHKCEAIFKAFAHSIKMAVAVNGDKILSSKGSLG